MNAENDKETYLNMLKEEYNTIMQRKNILKDHNEIIKEYLIYFYTLAFLLP